MPPIPTKEDIIILQEKVVGEGVRAHQLRQATPNINARSTGQERHRLSLMGR